ncbi:hypothetical protein [Leptolyngbya sp. O-77]|uniref:hypothetical protein n=1 Tax=Leptolyngbya sp. O-77 TaxID=1080068 RepID=UPI00074D4B63|nr:hypothetical protein [Leptolyngbya sp. O-77]BAU42562.1 hypothetical protein O77CONTIG1_02383 [Leptolyngbya sp. O-77]
MQITLSVEQSKILETLSLQGRYRSIEDAIDAALLLLADEVTEQSFHETPEHLAWVEQARRKIDEGITAAEQGSVLDADNVLAQLRQKVDSARAESQ